MGTSKDKLQKVIVPIQDALSELYLRGPQWEPKYR